LTAETKYRETVTNVKRKGVQIYERLIRY